MKAYCGGNGQLCNITMQEISNTLDCMHDQQMTVIEESKWIFFLRSRVRFARTATPEAIRVRTLITTCFLSSRILRGGVQRLTLANRKEGTDGMETTETAQAASDRKYVLRRLTPLECLRLMGLPDWWCDGANGSDSAIYKMCGNGITIPTAYDCLKRLANELEMEEANG